MPTVFQNPARSIVDQIRSDYPIAISDVVFLAPGPDRLSRYRELRTARYTDGVRDLLAWKEGFEVSLIHFAGSLSAIGCPLFCDSLLFILERPQFYWTSQRP